MVKQRRGKKATTASSTTQVGSHPAEVAQAQPVSTSSSTAVAAVVDDSKKHTVSLEEQLDRADVAVRKNQAAAESLHDQWRRHLLNISYLVLVICFHQAQGPIGVCLRDMKALNNHLPPEDRIDALKAFLIVVRDDMIYLLSIGMAASLSFFLLLRDPPGNFSSRRYMTANAFLPGILMLRATQGMRGPGDATTGSPWNWGCVDRRFTALGLPIPQENRPQRSFPVVIIFHVIVTLSYFFMERQSKQHQQNILTVQNLRKELMDARVKSK